MTIGFALCGSYCTYQQVFPILELLARDYRITPIFSYAAASTDSRFGSAKDHMETAAELCNADPILTVEQA